MIDLNDIEARIAEGIYGDARMPRAARNDAFSALAEIIAEVKRLRAEIAAERAAVVSALERWAEDGGDPWMSYCAERVKSGEHRREEEP
jgi:hypothetical protein